MFSILLMTRKTTPNICDFCQDEIPHDEMSYTVQFNQKQPFGQGTKGEFVSSTNRADLCKRDFLKFQEGNFKVKWKHMKQQADKSWKEIDPQTQIA